MASKAGFNTDENIIDLTFEWKLLNKAYGLGKAGIMLSYGRILERDIYIEHFVDNILEITDIQEKREAINLIASAERNMKDYGYVQTLSNTDNRDFEYRDPKVREMLRQRIIKELFNKVREDDEDNIVLGSGGAVPSTPIRADKNAYYIIGPPASGKSCVANKIADEVGGYILDSDYAKRKLPEFSNQVSAASLIHEESDALIFSYGNGNLLELCLQKSYNIVIPKIGYSISSICKFCKSLQQIGYSVFLISIDLDRKKATQRAYDRFKEKKRYVPLSLIFDEYANEPTLNYFKIKQKNEPMFSGYAQISTDVPIQQSPILVEETNMSFLHRLFGGDMIGRD